MSFTITCEGWSYFISSHCHCHFLLFVFLLNDHHLPHAAFLYKSYASNWSVVHWVFFYDATMDYFDPEHLPYAMLAIAIAVVFLVLPLMLVFLYPTGLLHNGLQVLCLFPQAQTLITFMKVYTVHFKDGTEGNEDYRYFAGGQLLFTLLSFIFFQTQEHVLS